MVEAGGQKEVFAHARAHANHANHASVEWTMKNVAVRCSGFLAPVLSSHTCNRW